MECTLRLLHQLSGKNSVSLRQVGHEFRLIENHSEYDGEPYLQRKAQYPLVITPYSGSKSMGATIDPFPASPDNIPSDTDETSQSMYK